MVRTDPEGNTGLRLFGLPRNHKFAVLTDRLRYLAFNSVVNLFDRRNIARLGFRDQGMDYAIQLLAFRVLQSRDELLRDDLAALMIGLFAFLVACLKHAS